MFTKTRCGRRIAQKKPEMGVVLQMFWTLFVLTSTTSAVAEIYASAENNVAEPPALMQKLSVYAVEHDAETRSLQLYVNWTAPSEGPLPLEYFLTVKSINQSSDYCNTTSVVEELNSTVTSFLVPPKVSEVEGDFRVLHECTYNVRVECWWKGGRGAAELNYTVPELVGSLWSCRRSSMLPLPRNLHVSVVDDAAVDVTWELDAAHAQLAQSFSLMLGTEIVSELRDWFEYGPEVLVEAGNWSGGPLRMMHRLEGDLRRPVRYLAQVRVVDRRGCRGPLAEQLFTTGLESTSRSQLVLFVAVPVVSLAVAAAVAAALLCRRRASGRREMQPAQPWLDGYSSVVAQSSNGHSSITDVVCHPETEMEVSYASDIELLGIKAISDDV